MAVDLNGMLQIEGIREPDTDVHSLAGPPIGTQAQHFSSDGDVVLNFDAPIHPYVLRTGVLSHEPSFTYQTTQAGLRSTAAFEAGELSPPGINLLFYADASPQEQFVELEHLGIIRKVAPGQSISFLQHLSVAENLEPGARAEPSNNLQSNAPLVLNYLHTQGISLSKGNHIAEWSAPLQAVPVFLEPISPERPPLSTSEGVAMDATPLNFPRLSTLQGAGPEAARKVSIRFQAPQRFMDCAPAMLYEIGGSGNGYNLYLKDDRLIAGVWGKDAATGSIDEIYLTTQIEKADQWIEATLDLDPAEQKATLLINGAVRAIGKLPKISPHRDRCTIGGVQGTTRINGSVEKSGFDFVGTIDWFKVEM